MFVFIIEIIYMLHLEYVILLLNCIIMRFLTSVLYGFSEVNFQKCSPYLIIEVAYTILEVLITR